MIIRTKTLILIVLLLICVILLVIFSKRRKNIGETIKWTEKSIRIPNGFIREQVYITVVACGARLEESLIMIKSALMFGKLSTFLNFKIIAEDILKKSLQVQLTEWQSMLADTFSFEIYSLRFPKSNEKDWMGLFKPCAAQRLFLPSLLQNIDATIYVDTDVLFLSAADDLWDNFSKFNVAQIAGLSPEHEDVNIGWYSRFARHPFFGKLGVNSGVMLMNLTRMRDFNWENRIMDIYSKYKSKITWGDQDLINILFYYHPDKLYIFPCIYNYRPDHCMYMNLCNITEGIRILHGNRGYFHSEKQPLFKKVYEMYQQFSIMKNVPTNLTSSLNQILEKLSVKNSFCGKVIKMDDSANRRALTGGK